MSEVQIDELSYRHETIVDYMISHPNMNQNAIANALGYTAAWLSTIVNSDAFKVYYAQRRDEHNKELHEKVVGKLYEVALEATEKVLDALDQEDVDPRFALDAKDKALHRLGYGPNKGTVINAQQNNIHNHPVDPELLALAKERLNGPGNPPALEVKAEEVPSRGEDS